MKLTMKITISFEADIDEVNVPALQEFVDSLDISSMKIHSEVYDREEFATNEAEQ